MKENLSSWGDAMICKNSFSILSNRFSLVYKTLFYVLVVALVIVALAAALLLPTLSGIVAA